MSKQPIGSRCGNNNCPEATWPGELLCSRCTNASYTMHGSAARLRGLASYIDQQAKPVVPPAPHLHGEFS